LHSCAQCNTDTAVLPVIRPFVHHMLVC